MGTLLLRGAAIFAEGEEETGGRPPGAQLRLASQGRRAPLPALVLRWEQLWGEAGPGSAGTPESRVLSPQGQGVRWTHPRPQPPAPWETLSLSPRTHLSAVTHTTRTRARGSCRSSGPQRAGSGPGSLGLSGWAGSGCFHGPGHPPPSPGYRVSHGGGHLGSVVDISGLCGWPSIPGWQESCWPLGTRSLSSSPVPTLPTPGSW